MNIDAIHGFIKGLETHFTPPKHPTAESSKAWLTMMVNALHGSSPEVLDRARIRMVETRTNRYFPLIAEIRKACREAADELKFDQYTQTLPTLSAGTTDEWSSERLKMAYEINRSTQIGKTAAKEGWSLSLWTFVRKNLRAPTTAQEIEGCKRTMREFDAVYAECVRGNGGVLNGALVKLGDGMLNKREKLRQEALGR